MPKLTPEKVRETLLKALEFRDNQSQFREHVFWPTRTTNRKLFEQLDWIKKKLGRSEDKGGLGGDCIAVLQEMLQHANLVHKDATREELASALTNDSKLAQR